MSKNESGNETDSIEVELGDGSTIPASEVPFDGPIHAVRVSEAITAGVPVVGETVCGVVGCEETNPSALIGTTGAHNGIYCEKHVRTIFAHRASGAVYQ